MNPSTVGRVLEVEKTAARYMWGAVTRKHQLACSKWPIPHGNQQCELRGALGPARRIDGVSTLIPKFSPFRGSQSIAGIRWVLFHTSRIPVALVDGKVPLNSSFAELQTISDAKVLVDQCHDMSMQPCLPLPGSSKHTSVCSFENL